MMNATSSALHAVTQVSNMQSGPDLVCSLATLSLIRARRAIVELRDTVLPALSPTRRTFPEMMLRRIEKGDIFRPQFLSQLESLVLVIRQQIDEGTHVGWEADDHHVAGGYEVIYHDEGVAQLIRAAEAMESLALTVSATLSAAEAVRAAETLLG